MMSKEIMFSNLSEMVVEKNNISNRYESSKWRIAEYKIGKCEGNMLIAPECEFPENITLKLNIDGIYRIYLCIPKLRCENYLYVKLTDDLCYTGIRPTKFRPKSWGEEEFFEEVYWKTADLSGKDIVIGKPDAFFDSSAALCFIRCVPVSETEDSEVIHNKCMQMHMDEDSLSEDKFCSDEDYLIRLYQMKDSNAEFVSYEIAFDFDKPYTSSETYLHRRDKRWGSEYNSYISQKGKFYKQAVDFAHANGLELYAANRMSLTNFTMPYTRPCWDIKFVKDNPQYYCQMRNESSVAVCSYAYDEVQEYMINNFIEVLKYGFDGVTLIFHRGLHIAFEEPVIEKFKELYPDIDPHVLPFSDKRLHDVLCGFMNQFMKKLRVALDSNSDRHIKVNVIIDYGLETSKHLGLDVEYWAKNGLVDSVSQGDMEIYEDLHGCMSEQNPEFIDLERYNRALSERQVIKRNYGTDVEKVCKHIPEFARLGDNYNIDIYNVIPWVHRIIPEKYDEIISRMKDAGAKKFLSWNTNHLVWDLPEWHAVSKIGNNRNDDDIKREFHRVLSLDGHDISQFYANWRG